MNAIERLRELIGYAGTDAQGDALDAVEALHQAAKAVSDGHGPQPADESDMRALAAAVRQMEGPVMDAPRPTQQQGMPRYGIDRDYPLLCEKARAYDFAERLGGCSDPLLAEIDAALRELWDARRYVTEEASRA